MPDNIELIK